MDSKQVSFVVCNWTVFLDKRMSWQDIMSLQSENQDIESHTMSHHNLNNLSSSELTYEVGQSKKCLADHGIKASIFAPPHGNDWKNATVINTVSKYYDLATGGFSELMFLHCDGYKMYSSQTDCRTYFDNGSLTFVNRYSIREWSHNAEMLLSHLMLQRYLKNLLKKFTIKQILLMVQH